MNALVVAASTALMRIFPLIVGVVLARVTGASDYADFVLSLSMFNVLASCIQLGVVPQLIRSHPNTEWGSFMGMAAFAAIWLFVPIAAGLVIGTAQDQSAISVSVAAGTSFGMLTGSVAIAILCREKAFAPLLRHAVAFSVLGVAPLLVAMIWDGSARIYATICGVWIGLLGCSWLLVVTRGRHRNWSWLASRRAPWREFARDAMYSASFGVMMMAGLYLANIAGTHVRDPANRATVAIGLQLFAAVIFIPSALSSFVVPKLVGGSDADFRRVVVTAALSYLSVAVAIAVAIVLLTPIVERIYGIAISSEARIGLGFILFAAVLAATNAVFNQVFVATRQFARQMYFGGMWLLVLGVGLLNWEGRVAGPGMALSVAYSLLLVLSTVYFWKCVKSGWRAPRRSP